jgi:hypothetical protein
VDERIKRASAEAERTPREPAATAQRHDEEPAEIQRQSREGPSPALMALLGMLLGGRDGIHENYCWLVSGQGIDASLPATRRRG